MKFLVDAQLPLSLCRLLQAAGHDATHTLQLPSGNRTPDGTINEVSDREGRVVITKDTDFYYSHLLSRRPQRLLLVRTGNVGVRDLISLFQQHLPDIVKALEINSLVELDRSAVRIIA